MRVYIDPATMERRTEDRMPKGTASSFNWGRAEWLAMGWREIRHVAALPEGRRVTGYRVDVDTGEYCDLAVVSSVSIAEEKAAAEATRQAEILAFKEAAAVNTGDMLVAKVLIAVINQRLPVGQKITKVECIAEARNQLGI